MFLKAKQIIFKIGLFTWIITYFQNNLDDEQQIRKHRIRSVGLLLEFRKATLSVMLTL